MSFIDEVFHQLPHRRFRYNFGRLSLLSLSKAWGSVPVLGVSLRSPCIKYHFFSAVFPSQLEPMVGGALTRTPTLNVGLGIGRSLITSGSRTCPSPSCDGWVCDLGVVGAPFDIRVVTYDRGLSWGVTDFCFSFRLKGFNRHLSTVSVVHSDRPKHVYLSPLSDSRIRSRCDFAARGNGEWGKDPVLYRAPGRPWVVLLSTLLLLSYFSLSLGNPSSAFCACPAE